jgi:hypothetical protein
LIPHLIIYSLDLEDDRSGAVIAAGNHDLIIVGPAMHYRAALKRR